jgi:hypothetical protein
MITDGWRLDSGVAGYVVAWKNGQSRGGIKTHMDYSQEAYDAECTALSKALEIAARLQRRPERTTIFTDAHAAIRRMASEEPAPASYMPCRNGGTRTSRSCEGPDRTSPSRSDGARPMRGSPATRKPTNGPSLQLKNRTLEEWSRVEPVPCGSRNLSHTSSVKFRRRNGQRLASALEAGPLKRNRRCRSSRNGTERSRAAPRGKPPGSIS